MLSRTVNNDARGVKFDEIEIPSAISAAHETGFLINNPIPLPIGARLACTRFCPFRVYVDT